MTENIINVESGTVMDQSVPDTLTTTSLISRERRNRS